jgi:hypothetical protein
MRFVFLRVIATRRVRTGSCPCSYPVGDGFPEAWLADVIARIADHPINQIDDLLPGKWRPEMSQDVAA